MKSTTKQFGRLVFSVIAIAITMLTSAAVHASTSATAYYQLGEADTSAAANTPPLPGDGGGAVTVDSSGHGFNLTETGTPIYSSNVPSGIGSTLSMQFTYTPDPTDPVNNPPLINDYYSRPAPLTTSITNILMDAWAYATNTTDISFVAMNGDAATGYGFLQYGSLWSFYEPFVGFNFGGTVVPNQWVHLSLMLDDNGHLTGYINGAPVVTNNLTVPVTPINTFLIGGGFNGNIDNVEFFTPEPASASILVVSGLALMGVRRRR